MCHICFLEYDIPNCGTRPGYVVDVDEHDFEASGISETILNGFLLKNWILNMRHTCFWLFYELSVVLPQVDFVDVDRGCQ